LRGYTIGALASACAVGRDTIRYYERSGLMPRPDRTVSGYRIYGHDDVERVNFIKTAQSLGFTLNEIGQLLSIRGSETASASDVVKLTEQKIRSLSGKLRQLRAIKQALEQLVSDCPIEIPASDCPILKYISHPPHRHRHNHPQSNQALVKSQ
jgi:Hg(II)-responsive transcriptional regulator